MKKILYSLIGFAVLAQVISSCKKTYLDTLPTDALPSELVFTTTTNALAALNGIHRSLYYQYLSNQDEGGQGTIMIYMDMLGEDLVQTTQGNGWFNSVYQWTSHRNVQGNGTASYFAYYFYYKLIANANMIINNIDKAAGTDADRKSIKGEALCYRAWAHFMLVQMYGKRYDATAKPNSQLGVPLLITSTIEGQPRATVEQVYTQVNKDLDDAITNLTGYTRTYKSHFNVNVAKGIKARVALTQQNWADAVKYASEARQGNVLMSNADYTAGFNNITNTEWMWGSQQIAEQTTYFYSFFAFMSANYNSTNIRTNPKAINARLYRMIPATDIRKQMWDSTGASIPVPASGVKKPFANKKFLVTTATSIGDIPLMRTAEMYLIEAEAQARLGQNSAAADALFTLVKNRDTTYVKSVKTGTDLINEILMYRRAELWGEGFRYLDLKRMNLNLDRTGSNHDQSLAQVMNVPAGDNRWEFLFPQNEVDANKAIVQNPL